MQLLIQPIATGREERSIAKHTGAKLPSAPLPVYWGPTGNVLKQTNGSNPAVITEVEPMPGPARHPYQIAGGDLDSDDSGVFGMNVEKAVTGNYEHALRLRHANSRLNLASISASPGVSRPHINHIGSDVATPAFN